MNVNVNCIYNKDGIGCTHPDVKRSVFGIGPRMCKNYPYDKGCTYQEKHPRPQVVPTSPPPAPKSCNNCCSCKCSKG